MVGRAGCFAHPLTTVPTVMFARHMVTMETGKRCCRAGGDQSETDEAAGTHR